MRQAGYLHVDEILIVLVVFGEVGLDELLGARQGFVPAATKQRYPEEAQAGGHQRGKGCPDEASCAALQQTCRGERGGRDGQSSAPAEPQLGSWREEDCRFGDDKGKKQKCRLVVLERQIQQLPGELSRHLGMRCDSGTGH